MSEPPVSVGDSVAEIASRDREVPAGYKCTEVGVIPDDWHVTTLGEIATIRDGTHQTPDYVSVGIPFYSVEHVTNRNFSDTRFISEKEHRILTRTFKIEKGDILMTRIGSIGDCVLVDWDVEASFYVSLALLKVHGAHAPFVSAYSDCSAFKKEVEFHSLPSATPKKINLGPISDVRIPLPRDNREQETIAGALSDIDRLLESLDALITKKNAVKQASSQQLLTGKTRLPGFSGAWETKPFDDLAFVDPENLSSTTGPNYEFNYISLEQVDAGRLLGFTQEVFRTAPSRARRVLRHDDVLMSTVRPNLMAHLHYRSQVRNAVCSTGFAVLRARPKVSHAGFLFAHLFGTMVNDQIDKTLAGSNYPAISGSDVRKIEVCCPRTVDEQSAIAGVLSDMDAEIAELESRRNKTHAIKQGMMQQLLTGRVRLV